MTQSNQPLHPIALGTIFLGSDNLIRHLDFQTTSFALHEAVARGSNFLDTSYFYGLGECERLLAPFIKYHGRDRLFVSTKAGHHFSQGKWSFKSSADFLTQSIEAALERLDTDYLDLFTVHSLEESDSLDESLEVLMNYKDKGILRHIGLHEASLNTLGFMNQTNAIDVYFGHYSVFNASAEQAIFPYLLEHSIAFIPYLPLKKGLHDDRPGLDLGRNPSIEYPLHSVQHRALCDRIRFKTRQLQPLADRYHTSMASLLRAYYLEHPLIETLIADIKTKVHVKNYYDCLEINLSLHDIQRIQRIFA